MTTDPALPEDPERRESAQVIQFSAHAHTASDRAIERAYRGSYGKLVRFLTLRIGSEAEAQDLAQATFLKLWQRKDTLTDQNLISLLFVTARNLATDLLRSGRLKRASLNEHSETELEGVIDEQPSAERIELGRRDVVLLQQIIAELPSKCRIAFIEYKFEGSSYGEIAERMGVTESMVRKYVRRAIVHCAARFSELEGWE